MRFAFSKCVFASVLVWLLHASVSAQSISVSTTSVSMPLQTTDYDPVTGAAQIIRTSAHTLSVSAKQNTSWTVHVRAQAASFSFTPSSGDANPNKPASDLAVRAPNASLTWLPLTTSNQVLGRSSGNATGQPIDYRLNSNLSTNPPGNYSISVIYTVTSP